MATVPRLAVDPSPNCVGLKPRTSIFHASVAQGVEAYFLPAHCTDGSKLALADASRKILTVYWPGNDPNNIVNRQGNAVAQGTLLSPDTFQATGYAVNRITNPSMTELKTAIQDQKPDVVVFVSHGDVNMVDGKITSSSFSTSNKEINGMTMNEVVAGAVSAAGDKAPLIINGACFAPQGAGNVIDAQPFSPAVPTTIRALDKVLQSSPDPTYQQLEDARTQLTRQGVTSDIADIQSQKVLSVSSNKPWYLERANSDNYPAVDKAFTDYSTKADDVAAKMNAMLKPGAEFDSDAYNKLQDQLTGLNGDLARQLTDLNTKGAFDLPPIAGKQGAIFANQGEVNQSQVGPPAPGSTNNLNGQPSDALLNIIRDNKDPEQVKAAQDALLGRANGTGIDGDKAYLNPDGSSTVVKPDGTVLNTDGNLPGEGAPVTPTEPVTPMQSPSEPSSQPAPSGDDKSNPNVAP